MEDVACRLLPLGGETAEMPGMYARGEYDLRASVGIVRKSESIDGTKIFPDLI